jgi:hypothetical protein
VKVLRCSPDADNDLQKSAFIRGTARKSKATRRMPKVRAPDIEAAPLYIAGSPSGARTGWALRSQFSNSNVGVGSGTGGALRAGTLSHARSGMIARFSLGVYL